MVENRMRRESIDDDKEYISALLRIEDLMYKVIPGSKGGDELEHLLKLIEKYEDENYPFAELDDLQSFNNSRELLRENLIMQFRKKK